MTKKLRRSKSDKIVAGVCGGIGKFFNIDPVIIRVIWFILIFTADTPAILAYLICMIVIPEEDGTYYNEYSENEEDENFKAEEFDEEYSKTNKSNSLVYLGIGLILIGAYLLIKRIFPEFAFQFLRLKQYWPILLIILGIYIIANKDKNS